MSNSDIANSENDRKPPSRRWPGGIFGRFAKADRGTAAIEFGFVAIPFFTLLFAILETALVFLNQAMLDSGLNEAARLVRTGQAQFSGLDEAGFRQAVCDNSWAMIDCGGTLYVDVRAFPNFNDINVPDPIDADGEITGGFGFNGGIEGDVVVARVFYNMTLFSPTAWGIGLGNLATGDRLLSSAATFRNEPFGGALGP